MHPNVIMIANEIWIPKGTEVLTTEGWSKIEYFFNSGGQVMTVNLGKRSIQRQKVTSLEKRQYTGKINEIRAEFSLLRFESAALINKKDVFDSFEVIPSISHTFKQVGYTGMLYSFQVPNCTAIFRNPFRGIDISDPVTLDEGLFTQDDYEDNEGCISYLDSIDVDETLEMRWAQKKERTQRETSGMIPDYWISRTKW